MKARNLILTLALCFAGVATCFAQNPHIGTWKLNEAKSKIQAGPKNTTVVYEAQGDNLKATKMASQPTPSGRASSTARTTRSPAIPRQTRVRIRRLASERWRWPTRRTAKLLPAVALSYLRTARAAPYL